MKLFFNSEYCLSISNVLINLTRFSIFLGGSVGASVFASVGASVFACVGDSVGGVGVVTIIVVLGTKKQLFPSGKHSPFAFFNPLLLHSSTVIQTFSPPQLKDNNDKNSEYGSKKERQSLTQ